VNTAEICNALSQCHCF